MQISPGQPGQLVIKFEYNVAIVEAIKQLPGHRWDLEGKFWTVADTPENRARLADLAAHPPRIERVYVPVKPKLGNGTTLPRPRATYIAGRSKPLTTNPPHLLIKKVDDELVLRAMAYGTRKSYGQHLRNYFDWLVNEHLPPEQTTAEQIRAYLVGLASSGRVSAAYCRGARSALIFLYEVVLKQQGKVGDLPRMKRPSQLPVVLSGEEVARLFKVTSYLKHRALLMIAYSAGLRVGEAVRLKVRDIHSQRMQIRVTAGKGAKDRYTLLSEKTLKVLRDYFRLCHPQGLALSGGGWRESFIRALGRAHLQGFIREGEDWQAGNVPHPAPFFRHAFA